MDPPRPQLVRVGGGWLRNHHTIVTGRGAVVRLQGPHPVVAGGVGGRRGANPRLFAFKHQPKVGQGRPVLERDCPFHAVQAVLAAAAAQKQSQQQPT